MRIHRPRRRRGFTLVELLVSVLILSLALVALSQLYMAAMWTYHKARYTSLATQRAQLELEQAEGLGYEKLAADPLIDPLKYPEEEYSALATGRGVQFVIEEMEPVDGNGTIKISEYDGHPELLQVEIEITW